MVRLVAAGLVMAAAATGCGTSREAVSKGSGLGPVGESPIPSIHDSINGEQFPRGVAISPPRPAETEPAPEGMVHALHGAGPTIAPAPLDPAGVALVEAPPATGVVTPSPSSSPPAMAADLPASLPPDLPAQSPPIDPGPSAVAQTTAGVVPGARPRVDPAVAPASFDEAVPAGKPIGEWVARVNDDIITWIELQAAVKSRLRDLPAEQQQSPEVRQMLASAVLDQLIDRTLILQHARRNELKVQKNWEMITGEADKVWERERLPAYMNQLKAKDRFELEKKLKDRGDSLHEKKAEFRLEFISRQYLLMKVGPKVHVSLPEMRSYYQEHRDHEQFQQPEQISWREVLVDARKHPDGTAAGAQQDPQAIGPGKVPDRASARARAEQALARLRRGEDFAAVARDLSDGPNAAVGGLWEKTSPGSYAVQPVNDALASQAPGQISPILEGPDGYHIVRVESHTRAGTMSFSEVQGEIRKILQHQKEGEEMDEYLKQLYRGSMITSVFREFKPRDQREVE